jgi:hypothetical protein
MDMKEIRWGNCGVDLRVACKLGNETMDRIKCGEFLD